MKKKHLVLKQFIIYFINYYKTLVFIFPLLLKKSLKEYNTNKSNSYELNRKSPYNNVIKKEVLEIISIVRGSNNHNVSLKTEVSKLSRFSDDLISF